MAPLPVLNFVEIKQITINQGKALKIEMDKDQVWKIESVGIGGSTGTVFLQESLSSGMEPIAILYGASNDRTYGSQLPFWIKTSFEGQILNDSTYPACVSVTVYSTVAS